METGGSLSADVVMWAIQAVIAGVVGIGVTGMLRWVRQVNKRLARIESRLQVRSHRR